MSDLDNQIAQLTALRAEQVEKEKADALEEDRQRQIAEAAFSTSYTDWTKARVRLTTFLDHLNDRLKPAGIALAFHEDKERKTSGDIVASDEVKFENKSHNMNVRSKMRILALANGKLNIIFDKGPASPGGPKKFDYRITEFADLEMTDIFSKFLEFSKSSATRG